MKPIEISTVGVDNIQSNSFQTMLEDIHQFNIKAHELYKEGQLDSQKALETQNYSLIEK